MELLRVWWAADLTFSSLTIYWQHGCWVRWCRQDPNAVEQRNQLQFFKVQIPEQSVRQIHKKKKKLEKGGYCRERGPGRNTDRRNTGRYTAGPENNSKTQDPTKTEWGRETLYVGHRVRPVRLIREPGVTGGGDETNYPWRDRGEGREADRPDTYVSFI